MSSSAPSSEPPLAAGELERRLEELCARRGRERVAAAMEELYAYSERIVRAAIGGLPDGCGEAEDVVEAVAGDLPIRCRAEIAGDEIRLDFTGTAPQYDGNLNCPLAVTKSACYFVVRCLTEPDLPASGGAFAPVAVTAPEGCFVNAQRPAAVVAGNTETSSRIVDVVFAALPHTAGPAAERRAADETQARMVEVVAVEVIEAHAA